MITLLDTMGPAIWRASWQAAVLALVVVLLLRCCGERLSPRWRFLLWGVVLARLLLVTTPVSPWSVFNLVHWNPEANSRAIAHRAADATNMPVPHTSGWKPGPHETLDESPRVAGSALQPVPAPASAPAETPSTSSGTPLEFTPTISSLFDPVFLARILSMLWLAGCLLWGLKLLATALVLRRRLSACRPVTDAALLGLLEKTRRQIGLKRSPALLVTPEYVSPCIVGTWNPRIVLPESIVTESSTARLRHVLAHELAHLVRGDLWTNWLLLTARILHWFNPVAWWTVREMQAQREAACDELALAALGETDRSAYAATIVELAASLAPSALAPGLVGLFSSTCRLQARVERLLRSPSVTTLRAPIAASLLVGMALIGLTDTMPGARAQAPPAAAPAAAAKEGPNENTHTVSGRCFNQADRTALAGITVRLYRVEGRTSPPTEVAKTVTDADGRYAFKGLEPPRPENHLDRLNYGVFGFAADRPIGISFFHFDANNKEVVEIKMAREKASLSGKVIDAEGRPIAGATVLPYFVWDRPIPTLLSATTDAEGRFKLDNLGVNKWPGGKAVTTSFVVLHPDYPETRGEAKGLPADVIVTLPTGCLVTGTVTDIVTDQPAAGAVVTARRVDQWGEICVAADKAGRFRLVLLEGRYDFLADTKDRVCVAVTGRECLAGEKVELSGFKLISGGLISGQVVNTVTGESVTVSEFGGPIMLGLFGPSQPSGRAISPMRLAAVDKTGRFTLRAAPGENFPYFVNISGERMSWDTQKQPPVVVKDGETTTYNMLITPEVPPEEKLKAARKVVLALSEKPSDRTAQILLEFRKLNQTVDETELWCLLMRELVAVGREAVPQLCAELDRTTENVMLRRLGFALRAIGDKRAVPALIRALPKTLLPSSSDYGLLVADKGLMAFMQSHDLDKGKGEHFGLGSPEREIIGALHALTKQNFADAELFSMSLSEDPRRQVLQRRIYVRQAQRWQAWWEKNSRNFTDDAGYQKVNLKVADEPLPPATAPEALGRTARLSGEWSGAVLSPAIQEGEHAWHFYDLDTGYRPIWPTAIPKVEASRDAKELAEWASQNGVDLMCITHRAQDGTETYVLRAMGMKVREIDARDVRNLDKLIAAGTLPEGRPVGELLMHYDAKTEQLVPDANAAFLFITREGSMGVIETTDRITRTADLTGVAASPSSGGVGFHKGVQFDLKAIIP